MNSPDTPKDAKTVASYVTHIVSDTPVETHVFASLLYDRPLYVGTMDGNVWKVEKGAISKTAIKVDVPAPQGGKGP